MRRGIDSCEVGKSPDARRLIRATGNENPERSPGYLLSFAKVGTGFSNPLPELQRSTYGRI